MRMCKISENCLIFVLIFTLCYTLILVASSETGMIESTLLNDAKNQINTIKTDVLYHNKRNGCNRLSKCVITYHRFFGNNKKRRDVYGTY